jgi:hypothetical protein
MVTPRRNTHSAFDPACPGLPRPALVTEWHVGLTCGEKGLGESLVDTRTTNTMVSIALCVPSASTQTRGIASHGQGAGAVGACPVFTQQSVIQATHCPFISECAFRRLYNPDLPYQPACTTGVCFHSPLVQHPKVIAPLPIRRKCDRMHKMDIVQPLIVV